MLLDPTPPADAALLVFVRDTTPCDGGDPFRIVDSESRFIGESTPASKFAVRVTPGVHSFFAWQPHNDLPADLYPNANQVGALSGDFAAGKTYTIEVSLANHLHGLRKTCAAYEWVALHIVDADNPAVAEVLARASPFAPDVVAGQNAVNADLKGVAAHIELGQRKLGRVNEPN